MNGAVPSKTIGILYPGEMGSTLGNMLANEGNTVITTVADRSERTARLCEAAGLTVRPSLAAVVQESDVILSLVPPDAALELAKQVSVLATASINGKTFVDANSISPLTMEQIAREFDGSGMNVVDACIFGLAAQLKQRGLMCFSGPGSCGVSDLFAPVIRVKEVGATLGDASVLKMIISGIPKGISAMLVEIMLFARRMNLLDEAMQLYGELYPNVIEVTNRMLPTYPTHAARRREELLEVEKTILATGGSPRMLHAAREITAEMAGTRWDDHASGKWEVKEIIDRMYDAMKTAP